MPILKIDMFSTQKSAMTLLFNDFDFSPNLQGLFRWFVNLLLSNLNFHQLKMKSKYEPLYDKANKMTVRPAKIQISLGIRQV